MSLPGTIPVMVDPTECRGGSISVPVKDVVTDELRTFRHQELDETCPSHPDEMDELKSDIKLEIEGEESANNPSDYSNVSSYTTTSETFINLVLERADFGEFPLSVSLYPVCFVSNCVYVSHNLFLNWSSNTLVLTR